MLNSAIRRQTIHNTISNRLRDLVLTVLVGMVAGNLLLALSGGFPLASTASAASEVQISAPISISNLTYRLNPNNPSQIGEVQLQTGNVQGESARSVRIRTAGQSAGWVNCLEREGIWTCPLRGVAVAEFSNLEIQAN